MDSKREVAYCKTEIHRNVATAQFGGGIDVRTQLKLLFPIGFGGEFGDFYTFREDWLSSFSRLRRGHTLVNMEDRVLDRFADHQS